jgi:hypothetical protein
MLALLLVVLVVGVPRLMDPQSWILAQAVLALGPLSGWRCAQSATYVYDPSQEQPDGTLLSERPEVAVLEKVPWLEVTEVDANLRGGDTLVKVHGINPDGGEDRRVYELSPGRLQGVTVSVLGGQGTLCNAHLASWQIVGEQELG